MLSLRGLWRWYWPLICLREAPWRGCLLLWGIGGVWAQKDTAEIAPIVIVAEQPFRTYSWRSDSLGGWQVTGNHLSHLLSQVEGLYIRDYGGEGALKTVSLRGLSPAYTAIAFQGFPIRQPQLGIVNIAPFFLSGFSEVSFSGGGELAYHTGGAGRIDLAIKPRASYRWVGKRLGRYGEAAIEVASGSAHTLWHASALTSLNQYPYNYPAQGLLNFAAYRLLRSGLVAQRGQWETTLWGYTSSQEIPGPIGPYGPRLPPEFLREWQITPTLWHHGKWTIGFQSHHSRLFYKDYLGLSAPTQQHSIQSMLRRSWSYSHATLQAFLYGAFDYLESSRIGMGFKPISFIQQGEIAGWLQITGTLQKWRYRWEGRLSWLERFLPEWSSLFQIERNSWGLEALRGLRWPSLYERYWIGYGRADLRPERFWQVQGYAFGQKGPWSARTVGSLAWVHDRILTVPLSPVRWQAYNLGFVRTLALEFQLGYTGRTTQIRLSATYTQAQDFSATQGRPLPYVPPWTGLCWINQRFRSLEIHYQTEYVSTRPISLAPGSLNLLPPYLLHSVSVSWRRTQSLIILHFSRWARESYAIISGYPMPIQNFSIEWRWKW